MDSDFAPYLSSGEKLTWTGRPAQGVMFRPIDALLVPLSVLWAGGVFNIAVGNAGLSRNPASVLVSGLFCAVALYLMAGRFLIDAFLRSRMRYAVTDRRALFLGGFSRRAIAFISLQSGTLVRFNSSWGDRGTIVFGEDREDLDRSTWWAPASLSQRQFFRIKEGEKVYQLVQNARMKV